MTPPSRRQPSALADIQQLLSERTRLRLRAEHALTRLQMSVEAGGSAQLEHDAWDALVALRRVEVRVQALTRATAAAAGGNGDAAPDRERE